MNLLHDTGEVRMGTFDWVSFEQGRARFSGGIRGADERGHETFAIEIDGTEYFGEINMSFLQNGNDYNLEIISFGHYDQGYVGSEFCDIRKKFSKKEIENIKSTIDNLIKYYSNLEKKPYIMTEYDNSHFAGDIIYRNGWISPLSSLGSEEEEG